MKYISIIMLVMALSLLACTPKGKAVQYTVNGDSYEGYYITPSGENPLILLVHDWDGLTDYEIKRAGMLAELGYSVFAVDMFGAGIRPNEISEMRRLTEMLYNDRKKMRSLLNGALTAAEANGADIINSAAVGYCFGGAVVLELARSGADMKGFVSFHGGLATPQGQDYSKTKGKLLILHGTADSYVTIDDFASLAKLLEKNKVNHEMTTYSGAPHAFTVFGSDRYREDADKKSWNRFTGFLEEIFK